MSTPATKTVEPPEALSERHRDLLEMLRAYTEVTARLQDSHERLKAEVARLRDELAAKNRELRRRERLAALGQMAAGLAHEIRNPLGGIALYASLLEKELDGQPDLLKVVRRIAVGVESLNRLVSNILEFARPHEPNRQLVPVTAVLSRAVAALKPILEDKSICLMLPQGDGLLFVDAEQFARALINLIRNAAEAVAPGGRVAVRVRCAADGAAVLWIEDDGPGIPDDLAESVFEPFVTTKHTGTGLGLAIVHQIVEAHGGRIRLKRSRLGGAKFSIHVGGRDGAVSQEPLALEAKHV